MFSLKLYLNSTKCQEEKNVKALPFLKQLYCQNRLTVSHKDLGFFSSFVVVQCFNVYFSSTFYLQTFCYIRTNNI